jgi:hypothetical protein
VCRMLVRQVGLPSLAPNDTRDPVRTGSTATDLTTKTDIAIARTTDIAIARIVTVAATADPAGLACGHPTGGAASGCVATNARNTDIGTAIIIARTTDIGTANIVRTRDVGTAVAEHE